MAQSQIIHEVRGLPASPLDTVRRQIDSLCQLGENWNGGTVDAPIPAAIEKAKVWIQELIGEVQLDASSWIAPHVTANEEGHVVFEWVQGRKRLSIFVTPTEVWYIKAWGPSTVTEMSDGSAETPPERLAVWSWITE